ncbi:MAG: Rieske 2Fe-2S domain-containing protein [Cyanobacteria bacterium P01_A01_bin.84]
MQTEFNFFQQWYPLSPLEDLDPKRPTPVTLLGMRLVIWKPHSSHSFQVFLDQCPHRLAPLSEGRVDEKTGNLMCSYHGWEFDQGGTCTKIPQADNPQILTKNQKQLCATSLPVKQESDLLWVWADFNTPEKAAGVPLPLSPQADASQGFVWTSYVRDLEYDWQTLIENVADPSHVPFTHHGVQGDRAKGSAIPFQILQSTADIIQVQAQGGMGSKITFEPPCHLEYEIKFGDSGKQLGLITYCIPVSPGKSRLVALFSRNFAKTLAKIQPRWLDHISDRNLVLDGDMIVLHHQERFLQQKVLEEENQIQSDKLSQTWKTAYQLPTSADRLIIEFRNWFDKYSQGKLPWGQVGIDDTDIPTTINEDRKALLNRYEQHTKHCSSCRNTLKFIQSLQIFLLAFFAIDIAIAAILPDQLRLSIGLPMIITGLLGLGIYTWLKFSLVPKFYFVDYIHPDKV